MMKNNRGFIGILLAVILAIAALSYFHIDVRPLWEQILRVFRIIWALISPLWQRLTSAQ